MPTGDANQTRPAWPERGVRALRQAAGKPAVRHAAFAVALMVMAGGTWIALTSVDLAFADLRWVPVLVLVLLCIPATVALNALEMELSAGLIGQRFGLKRALTLTVFASAANMLPLPGAAMVRVAGLASVGGTMRRATGITLAIAALWLGVALIFSGGFLLGHLPLYGAGALATGVAMTAGVFAWCRKVSGNWRTGAWLGLVKLGLVMVSVLRLYLCFMAIGEPAALAQVSVFAISGIVGSAVSIVPAGLGIRELVSAGLAPLVGLPAATAFLVTAIDRVAGMLAMVTLAAILTAADLRPGEARSRRA